MFFYALRLSTEHQLGAEMQKIKYDKIVFLALGLILMALVIQMAILNWINNKNTAKMSEVLLDRVVNVIGMKQCFGSYGRVYLIGGDEFVSIIFADESELKKIREDFDEVISHWSGMMVDELSISCGYVYSREKNWESFDEIANEADLRMYEAKEKYYSVEGRDRRR